MRSILLRLAAAFALLVAVAFGPPAQADGAGWYDGVLRESTIINCVSIIQGAPYQENGAAAYVGQYADPGSGAPAVNQAFYIHIVVVGLGNSCAGQRFLPGFGLPSGMSLATGYPIRCYAYGSNVLLTGDDCPQWDHVIDGQFGSGTFAYASTDAQHAYLWPLPQGKGYEFQIPVVSNRAMSGATLQGYAKIFDGNSTPTLTPSWGAYVFQGGGGGGGSTTPSIIYSGLGTTASPYLPYTGNTISTKYGIASQAEVITNKQPGNVRFQLSKTSSMSGAPIHDLANSSTTAPGLYAAEDWDEPEFFDLKPGTKYYWRIGYQPTGGSTTWGATKSFQTLTQATCNGQKITTSLALDQQPTAGNDVILGTTGNDNIVASGGSDTVCGGGGNDVVSVGDATPAYVNGGTGSDTISYASAGAGRVISLAGFASVENAVGSAGADTITGTSGANQLIGGAGDDTIVGGAGNDLVAPGTGKDTVDGGSGADTLTYGNRSSKVTVNLAKLRSLQAFDAANGVTIVGGFENLVGGKGNDQLTGTRTGNRLTGGPGNDKLNGAAGTDWCNGSAGRDTATGCEHKSSIP